MEHVALHRTIARRSSTFMDILYRRANADDCATLAMLCQTVQALHAQHHPRIFKASVDPLAVERHFREVVAAPANRIHLALVDGRAAGYAWISLDDKAESPFTRARRQLFVHHLSVEPPYRRMGIATALVQLIEHEARDHHASLICLATWDFNDEAFALFRKAGFSLQVTNLWKRFD